MMMFLKELHEKYKGKIKLRIKTFTYVGGGFMFHLTNTMFKTSLRGRYFKTKPRFNESIY